MSVCVVGRRRGTHPTSSAYVRPGCTVVALGAGARKGRDDNIAGRVVGKSTPRDSACIAAQQSGPHDTSMRGGSCGSDLSRTDIYIYKRPKSMLSCNTIRRIDRDISSHAVRRRSCIWRGPLIRFPCQMSSFIHQEQQCTVARSQAPPSRLRFRSHSLSRSRWRSTARGRPRGARSSPESRFDFSRFRIDCVGCARGHHGLRTPRPATHRSHPRRCRALDAARTVVAHARLRDRGGCCSRRGAGGVRGRAALRALDRTARRR